MSGNYFHIDGYIQLENNSHQNRFEIRMKLFIVVAILIISNTLEAAELNCPRAAELTCTNDALPYCGNVIYPNCTLIPCK